MCGKPPVSSILYFQLYFSCGIIKFKVNIFRHQEGNIDVMLDDFCSLTFIFQLSNSLCFSSRAAFSATPLFFLSSLLRIILFAFIMSNKRPILSFLVSWVERIGSTGGISDLFIKGDLIFRKFGVLIDLFNA